MKVDTMRYVYLSLILFICLSPRFSVEANDLHSAVKPVPRSGGWMKRHESFNQRVAKGKVDLVLIGDSITHGWEGNGWLLTNENYNSETHSQNSPNDETTLGNSWNLLSATYSLPELGDGESMHFDFFFYINFNNFVWFHKSIFGKQRK